MSFSRKLKKSERKLLLYHQQIFCGFCGCERLKQSRTILATPFNLLNRSSNTKSAYLVSFLLLITVDDKRDCLRPCYQQIKDSYGSAFNRGEICLCFHPPHPSSLTRDVILLGSFASIKIRMAGKTCKEKSQHKRNCDFVACKETLVGKHRSELFSKSKPPEGETE